MEKQAVVRPGKSPDLDGRGRSTAVRKDGEPVKLPKPPARKNK